MHRVRLLSKVRLPQRRPDTLRRGRLVDFLHENIDRRVNLLCTAAGYGKTTLLVDFVRELDLPVCWYSMDASDADPRSFLEYLILSIRQRFPGFGAQSEAVLQSVEDLDREITAVVASLSNEIQTDIPEFFLMVLDDFHCASESATVTSALDQFIYYLPDNCRLLVSTRTLPSLTYTQLAAQRQVAGLGTADLRFTAEELSRLLRDNYKISLPGNQAERLMEVSEGWVTGILLSTHTLWMGLVESLIKARDSSSPLFDYLANEAYLQQSNDVQSFLLRSSVLDEMTAEMCDSLFAGSGSAEMLRHLLKANLFITELEGPEGWYRYHNLFREYLRSRLKSEAPLLHTSLHTRAAEVAEVAEDWEPAFVHYMAAEQPGRAAKVVELASAEVSRAGRWRTLYRWFEALPAAIIDDRPALALQRGRTYLWAGEPEQAILSLDGAFQRFRLGGSLEEAGSALTLKATGLRLRGSLEEALAACSEALALQPDPSSRIAAEAHRVAAICLASQGNLGEADARLQRSLAIYEELGDSEGIASTCHNGGIIAARAGDLGRGLAYFQRALDLWRCFGSASSVAGVLNCIATVHFQTGEYHLALPLLDEALEKAREAGSLRSEACALAGLGDVRRDSGDAQGSLEPYEEALEIAHRLDEASLVGYMLDALANSHCLLGDYVTAERMLRQAIQLAEDSGSSFDRATYSVSAAVLSEEQGDLERAEGLLRSAVSALAGSGGLREQARAHFHLARTLFAKADHDGAGRELEASLELCRKLGYDRFMVAEGRRAGLLLAWAIARGIGGRRLELVGERLGGLPAPPQTTAKRPRIRLEAACPNRIEIYTLGQTRVLIDSRPVKSNEWAIEKTKELFFFLLDQHQGLRKEQIFDVLWPDFEATRANSHFHSTMYRLRRAVFPQCVSFDDGRYRLTLGGAGWCDASEFDRLLGQCEARETGHDSRAEGYEQAIALYRGPYLEEFYADWLVPRREELEFRYLRALIQLAKLRAEDGNMDRAAQLLQTAVAADPFQEDAHYGLVYYTALQGDSVTALRHYRRYEEMLREELDAAPGERVRALAGRIARGQPVS